VTADAMEPFLARTYGPGSAVWDDPERMAVADRWALALFARAHAGELTALWAAALVRRRAAAVRRVVALARVARRRRARGTGVAATRGAIHALYAMRSETWAVAPGDTQCCRELVVLARGGP
jgi:hypothetical protein